MLAKADTYKEVPFFGDNSHAIDDNAGKNIGRKRLPKADTKMSNSFEIINMPCWQEISR